MSGIRDRWVLRSATGRVVDLERRPSPKRSNDANSRNAHMTKRDARETDADRFILAQLHPVLSAGETVIVCAYLAPVIGGSGAIGAFARAATMTAAFAAITNRRLLLIHTRIGAFKPLLENHGIESIERSIIRGVHFVPRLPRRAASFRIEVSDGRMLHYLSSATKTDVSTQTEFLRRLPQMFGESAAAAGLARKEIVLHWGGLAVGTALGLAYVLLHLH